MRLYRISFCLTASFLFFLAVYILCLTPLFGSTPQEHWQAFEKIISWPIRMLLRSKNSMNAASSFVSKQEQATKDMMRYSKRLKLFQQYVKVFIGYFQVISGFVIFKVRWPGILGNTIAWIRGLSTLIQFDFMELPLHPSLACIWASSSYSEKSYVKLVTPIFVGLCCAMPVLGAWILQKSFSGKGFNFSFRF